MGRSDSQPEIIPTGAGGEIHPKGLLDAISYIDQNFANEMGGCLIKARFLTTKQRLEFMEVGFRSSFASGVISVLLTPIAIGVVERYIPMFGEANPPLFDQLCALLLALSFSLGYAVFIAKTSTQYVGEYTKSMVRNLLGGMIGGAALKAVLAFAAFHFMYYKIFSDENILWAMQNIVVATIYIFIISALALKLFVQLANKINVKDLLLSLAQLLVFHFISTILASNSKLLSSVQVIQKAYISDNAVANLYVWITAFKPIFITSAFFVVLSTIVFILIPLCTYLWASRRNNKLFDSGLVQRPKDNE